MSSKFSSAECACLFPANLHPLRSNCSLSPSDRNPVEPVDLLHVIISSEVSLETDESFCLLYRKHHLSVKSGLITRCSWYGATSETKVFRLYSCSREHVAIFDCTILKSRPITRGGLYYSHQVLQKYVI